ncbi:MAG: tyrosine-type recombinase/integrase [Aggregatilineales bacterium]
MKMSEAVTVFLGDKKPATAAVYRDILRSLQKYLDDCDVCDVTRMHLKRYQSYLRARNWKGKPLSQATINKYAKTTRVFFNWLKDEGVISESPGGAMVLIRVNNYVSADKAASDHEFASLRQYFIQEGKHRNLALLLFLNDTGCRVGGAARLPVSDVDFDNMRAIVTEKGDKTRAVTFGRECRKALRFWLDYRNASGGYVFSRDGSAIKGSGLSRALRRASQRLGLRNVSAHKFRNRKGFKLSKSRVPLTHAQRIMGHSSPSTTAAFYYTNDDELIESINRELIEREEKLATPLHIDFSQKDTG